MKQILVIEDNLIFLKGIKNILVKAGFNVITASDGWQGLELANEEQPDLIVCDVIMPGLDGFQLVKQLRKLPVIDEIPLIFLSAKDDPLSMNKGVNLGAFAFFKKPVNAKELLSAINKELQNK